MEPPRITPWDRRKQTGLIEALIDSCRMALFRPVAFYKMLSPQGGIGEPLLFLLIFSVVLAVFSFPSEFLNTLLSQIMAKGFIPHYQNMLDQMGAGIKVEKVFGPFLGTQTTWGQILAGQFCCNALYPVFLIVRVFILAAIYSVLCLFIGERIDFEMIFRVLVFAEVARVSLIINPIPFFRDLVFGLHWLILLTIGLRWCGGLSTGKATLLALLPVVVMIAFFCCCFCTFGTLGMVAQK